LILDEIQQLKVEFGRRFERRFTDFDATWMLSHISPSSWYLFLMNSWMSFRAPIGSRHLIFDRGSIKYYSALAKSTRRHSRRTSDNMSSMSWPLASQVRLS
jgi:hypothetical protein